MSEPKTKFDVYIIINLNTRNRPQKKYKMVMKNEVECRIKYISFALQTIKIHQLIHYWMSESHI